MQKPPFERFYKMQTRINGEQIRNDAILFAIDGLQYWINKISKSNKLYRQQINIKTKLMIISKQQQKK